MAYFRHLRLYGSSSRSATNFNASKDSSHNWNRLSESSLLTLFWKSLTYASSYLKPLTSSVQASKSEESPEKNYSVQSSSTTLGDGDVDTVKEVKSPVVQQASDAKSAKTSEDFGSLDEGFFDWISGRGLPEKKQPEVKEQQKKITKPSISKASLELRSRSLVQSLKSATTPSSRLIRLQEICKHLLIFPKEKYSMSKEGLLQVILRLRKWDSDPSIHAQIRITMSLLGYHDPPNANGIRILSIDGGGTRGIMSIEILRQLEQKTGKQIYELFDFICGVSSGAILALLLGGLRLSLDECETLYRKLSLEVFARSPIWGTGRLVWNHAYYDTTTWMNILKKVFEEKLLIETSKNKHSPKLAAISAVMNLSSLHAFVFRNYAFPRLSQSQYLGSCSYKMWEAVRASGAAPGYFEEFSLDEFLHQDGGVMINNPAALAIHEAHLLWPSEFIQCVVSLGSGRYSPTAMTDYTSTSLKTKLLKIIDSATDTEGVHITLHDLLSSNTYFRFNPYLTEFLYLDETRPEKLHQLKTDAQMYLRRNEYKLNHAVNILSQSRSKQKKILDWLHMQKLLFY